MQEPAAPSRQPLEYLSKRPQEQDQVLLILSRQLFVVFDDSVSLASLTCVRLDGLQQTRCATIVQEEHSLADSPQGGRTELVRAGISLRDAVREARTHVMQAQIGEKIGCHLGKAWRVFG